MNGLLRRLPLAGTKDALRLLAAAQAAGVPLGSGAAAGVSGRELFWTSDGQWHMRVLNRYKTTKIVSFSSVQQCP